MSDRRKKRVRSQLLTIAWLMYGLGTLAWTMLALGGRKLTAVLVGGFLAGAVPTFGAVVTAIRSSRVADQEAQRYPGEE